MSFSRAIIAQAMLDLLYSFQYQHSVQFYSLLIKSRQKTRDSEGADNFVVRPNNDRGDASDIRIAFTLAQVGPFFTYLRGKSATRATECLEYLAGRTLSERDDVPCFDVISRQPVRIYTIETNTVVPARDVKRRTFVGLSDKILQHWRYYGFKIQVLPKKRPESPQHGTKVIKPLCVFGQVAKLFERYGKSEDGRFSQFASLRQFLKREHRVSATKRVKQRKRSFNSINARESVILPIFSRLARCSFSQFLNLLKGGLTILSKQRFDRRLNLITL